MAPGAKASGPDFLARMDRAAESGDPEVVDMVIREQNAVDYALSLHEELTRERAAHNQTRASLLRAYDVIAACRKVLGFKDES